jgi:hypothetical protein
VTRYERSVTVTDALFKRRKKKKMLLIDCAVNRLYC